MSDVDVLVIGGGLLGVAVAHRLSELGRGVTLIEARAQVGQGASYANGAMLTPSMADPWNAPGAARVLLKSFFDPGSPMKLRAKALPSLGLWGLRFLRHSTPKRHRRATELCFRLAAYSAQAHRNYRGAWGDSFDAAPCGTMQIFRDAGQLAAARVQAESLTPLGLRFEARDRDGAVETEPQLAPIAERIAGALVFPDDEVGDARLFCERLAEDLVSRGAGIGLGVGALRLLRDGGRTVGAETSEGPIRARDTVLALGSDPDALARRAGLRLPIRPAKGYSITFDMSGWSQRPRLPVIDAALHAGVVPLGRRLRVVGTAEFAGHDQRLSPDRIRNLHRLLAAVYPALSAAARDAKPLAWTGFRPMSADGLPFIGAAGPGLWTAMGHGHLGWTMAAGSARLLADQMLGRPCEIDPAPYSPARRRSALA